MKVGRLAENIWKRSIRKNIKSGNIATVGRRMTTIPFSGRMGAIAVLDIVNSSLLMASDIEGVVLSLYIDGRCSEEYVQHIVKDSDETAISIGVEILGFDTHIIQGLKKPFITGYAVGKGESVYSGHRPCREEDIIVLGYIAMAGTAMIAEDKSEELATRFSTGYIDGAREIINHISNQDALKVLADLDVTYVQALSEGGINGALWEMADIGKVGIEVNLRDIPIRQETVEVCNYFDINPYELTSSGALLVTSRNGEAVVNTMNDCGIPAVIIGRTTGSNDKLIINEDEKRFLTIPAADGIYEIT